ncbi:O-antigen ligase family protein [Microcoleus sp. F10-B2]|uniref:O-antigen ligase family protein n=1 Tax=Microcoleus sp. F10-B2 TaxID=2818751 RepID=UPI002FD29A62
MGKKSSPIWLADSSKFALLTMLIVSAFLFGGSARYDVASLIVIRPISILAAAYAIYAGQIDRQEKYNIPMALIVLLFGYVAIQLIPLPPSIWQELPGRGVIAKIENAAGIAGTWRPMTMSPSRTLNTFFSLFVPFSVLLMMMEIKKKYLDRIAVIIIGLVSVGLILSIGQLLGPANGPLYFYKITNHGLPVGWFANRNHNAILLASVLPLFAWFVIFNERMRLEKIVKAVVVIFATILLVLTILMTGSRAGSVLVVLPVTIIALVSAGFLKNKAVNKSSGKWQFVNFLSRHSVGLTVAALLLVIIGIMNLSESEAILRFANNDQDAELRLKTLPYLKEMAIYYLPFGSGFGTFELVYKIVEPDLFLSPNYLNQAHNDPLQFVIEGGVVALLVLAVFLGWLLNSLRVAVPLLWRGMQGRHCPVSVWQHGSSLLAICIVMLGSVADYPARTPLIMAYLAVLSGLALRTRPQKEVVRAVSCD